jgi:hypothetical protein
MHKIKFISGLGLGLGKRNGSNNYWIAWLLIFSFFIFLIAIIMAMVLFTPISMFYPLTRIMEQLT